MPDITEPRADRRTSAGAEEPSTVSKLLWFAGLYCAGLFAVMIVAWFFRSLLGLN